MKEMMAIKPGPELNLRSEMWSEEADEFGIMILALGKTVPYHGVNHTA